MKVLSKIEYRIQAKKIRDGLSVLDRKTKNLAIQKNLFSSFFDWSQYQNIGVYLNIRSEVDTREIIKYLMKMGKKIFLPKLSKYNLLFYSIENVDEDVKMSSHVYEPVISERSVLSNDLDILIVPAIIFDKYGHRIGYGHGYYDRFLSSHSSLYTVGLSYRCCVHDAIPHDVHDRQVRALVMEDGSILTRKE